MSDADKAKLLTLAEATVLVLTKHRDELAIENANLRTRVAGLERDNEDLTASLPCRTAREVNSAVANLGKVYRCMIGEEGGYPEIGVVEALNAREQLASAYAEIKAAGNELTQLRAKVEILEDAATRAADWFYAAGVGMEKTGHYQEETALRSALGQEVKS